MKNSSILRILKTFDKPEIKEFGRYIRSEFFNTNENVILVYDHLRKFYPGFEEQSVSKSVIFKKLFPGAEYNDGLMRKLSFDLTRLAESYITYKRSAENRFDTGLNLLAELNKRKLDKLFTRHYREIEKEINGLPSKDAGFHRLKYQLAIQWSNYADSIRYKIDLHEKKESHNEKLTEKLFHFMNYFLLTSMNSYRALKYQGYADRFEFTDELLDTITEKLLEEMNRDGSSMRYGSDNPSLELYLCEIMLMRNKSPAHTPGSDAYFLRLKEILRTPSDGLHSDNKFSLYNILQQHCSYMIIRGFSGYISERFELDKIALKEGVYKSGAETHFPPPAFAAIVRNAAEAGDAGWAAGFVEQHKQMIEEDSRELVLNLSYALCSLHTGDFEASLKFLTGIKTVKRWEFKSAVKELTLQVFFELSMFVQAHYLADSYRHFLSSMTRNFSEERIESRLNFLKNYMALLRLKEDPSGNMLDAVKKNLETTGTLIFNRDWLMAKLLETDKRKR